MHLGIHTPAIAGKECRIAEMATQREAEQKLTRKQAKRKAVITQMLAERDQRQKVSPDEIRRLRNEGLY